MGLVALVSGMKGCRLTHPLMNRTTDGADGRIKKIVQAREKTLGLEKREKGNVMITEG